LLLCYATFNAYFKKPSVDKGIKETLSGEGAATPSYKTILDTTEKRIKDVNKQILERERQLEDSGW